jgi:sortase A
MNQILITEKLYVTPELKIKKKFYRFSFIASIFAIIVLSFFYIYVEYDKNKNEDISKDILLEMATENQENVQDEEEAEDVWKIIIESVEQQTEEEVTTEENSEDTVDTTDTEDTETTQSYGTYTASNGKTYNTVGTIYIPSINVKYPILSETSTALLKISPCKFYGPEPNEVGNLCIAGHNYKTNQFFSKVPNLVTGDVIEITDLSGRTLKYSVYDKYTVVPEDTSCTSQNTDGKKIVTLITCTNDNKKRVIVHAKEIV